MHLLSIIWALGLIMCNRLLTFGCVDMFTSQDNEGFIYHEYWGQHSRVLSGFEKTSISQFFFSPDFCQCAVTRPRHDDDTSSRRCKSIHSLWHLVQVFIQSFARAEKPVIMPWKPVIMTYIVFWASYYVCSVLFAARLKRSFAMRADISVQSSVKWGGSIHDSCLNGNPAIDMSAAMTLQTPT